ncbi:MAG: restriction endonuclease subunit S, partial [Parafannyhessea umbonata]|nr:restriction endonuclease subunit S [Parafannyhessea umbonata]
MSGNAPAIRFAGFTEPWEQRKLGELVSIASGMAPSLFNQGDQPYIKVDDLNHTQRVLTSTQSTVARSSCMAKIPAGSTIFAKRGAAIMTNKTRVTGVSAYMDTNMMALIPEGINGEFLYELIGTIGLSRIADTSTIPQINNKHIEPFIVTIPHSREEQQIVATFFTSLDNLITLHQRKHDQLVTLKKSLLDKMF